MLGVNAIGKSSRVTALVNYLETKFKYTELSYTTTLKLHNGNTKDVHIKNIARIYENGVMIIGRKNKMGVWVGMDLGDTPNWAAKLAFYKYVIDNATTLGVNHIIVEGYFNNGSMQGSPESLKKLGFTSGDYCFFIYDNVEQFLERCSNRVGKDKGMEWAVNSVGWRDNAMYSRSYDKHKMQEDENFKIHKFGWLEPIDLLVRMYFNDTYEYIPPKREFNEDAPKTISSKEKKLLKAEKQKRVSLDSFLE
jgi:hypothetical protein